MYFWNKVENMLPHTPNKVSGNIYRSKPVLCAIKATTQKGTRFIVKEGVYEKNLKYNSGCWRISGSQNDVVAWTSMPEYYEN